MLTDQTKVIVHEGACEGCGVPVRHVYHCEYPEIWAEAGTLAEGTCQLAQQLSRALDGVSSAWQRSALEQAVADVALFLETLADHEPSVASACQCEPRADSSAAPTLAKARAGTASRRRVGPASERCV